MKQNQRDRPIGKTLGLCCVLGASLLGAQVSAQEPVTWQLSSWLSRSHSLLQNGILPWAQAVEQATNGQVKIRLLRKPLGSPERHYALVSEGEVELAYGLHATSQDYTFLRARIGEFTGMGDQAEPTSERYFQVYHELLGADQEHLDTKPLALFVHSPSLLHVGRKTRERPGRLFNEVVVRTPGGYSSDLMTELGAMPVQTTPIDVRRMLDERIIDAATFPMEDVPTFGLAHQIKSSYTFPGGLYNMSWFLAVNQDAWDQLSRDNQQKIEALSGAKLSGQLGKAFDLGYGEGEELLELNNIALKPFSARDQTQIRAAADRLESQWLTQVNEQGFEAEKALNTLRNDQESPVP